jgi:acyl-CoA dehydrogenase
MILLNPKRHDRYYPDERSRQIMRKTISFFEMAARDIRALPKLEGTVHVNIALIVNFMPNYFFHPGGYPEVPQRNDPMNDDFPFDQGPARGLGKIRFHDSGPVIGTCDLPNINIFQEQIAAFRELLAFATPDDAQQKDVDFLLALGEIFTLVVYGQLVLENAGIYEVGDDLLDQIFDFKVRNFARHALNIYSKHDSTPRQMDYCLRMIRKPAVGAARFGSVWEKVHALKDVYEMNP